MIFPQDAVAVARGALIGYSSAAPSGGVVGENRLGVSICKEIKDRKAKIGEQQIKNDGKLTDPTRQHYYEPLHLCTLSSYQLRTVML